MQNCWRNITYHIIFVYFIYRVNSEGRIILLGFLLACIHLSLQQRKGRLSQMRRVVYSGAENQTTVKLHLHFGISLCLLHQSATLKLRNFFLLGKKEDRQRKEIPWSLSSACFY